ncbi:MAG: hypothetical protein MZV49_13235 [Rhodopseudomonas palustris]|nr:hypothetical protein [Rhodopseudomonas palustris]
MESAVTWGRLEYVLTSRINRKKTDSDMWLFLLCGVYQILFLSRVPDYAIIDESVSISKEIFSLKKSGFVNAVLKRVSQEKMSIQYPDSSKFETYVEANLSFPLWLAMKWRADYGESEAIAIMKALNMKKPLVFRAFRGTESLDADFMLHRTPVIEKAYEIKVPIQMARAGGFYVMNESSQLVPELLSMLKGDKALDAASSPGGKGFILKSLQAFDRVIFNDVDSDRIPLILENSRDLSITPDAVICSDMRKPPFFERGVRCHHSRRSSFGHGDDFGSP